MTKQHSDSKKRHSPTIGHSKSKHMAKEPLHKDVEQGRESPVIPPPSAVEEKETPAVDPTPICEPTPPPPPPPIDLMKTEPILQPLIVAKYTGEIDENGFYHGQGFAIMKGGLTYKGVFEHGKMHGEGTLTWPNGTIFTGDFVCNEIKGKGVYKWTDGSCYEGETLKGLRHGQGIFKCADGAKSYKGQWVEGKRNGKGILYYDAMGTSYYDGQWKDNQKEGNGTRRYRNGNTYQGQWKNNIREGMGTMRWYDLGQEYTGVWLNGLQCGHGENTWYLKRVKSTQYPLRNYYVGDFLNGERHGYGVFHYASGAKYEGEWMSNLKHGHGKFTFKNGCEFSGVFSDDRIQDFPDLILSGMATPDIARSGIPIHSPGVIRAQSIMGIPTQATDVFLDVDIGDMLMDYGYDLEQRQTEVNNILCLLLRHASHLKQLYKIYSCIGEYMPIDKTSIMSKLQYLRFLKDYGIHRLGCSVIELEKLTGEQINDAGYYCKKIFFRDFLHSTIRISDILYKDQLDEDCNTLSNCFRAFLNNLLVPPETVEVKGSVFVSVEKCQEVMGHLDFFMKMYEHYRHIYVTNGNHKHPYKELYSLKQRHLLFIFHELGLLSKDLTTTKLVEIVSQEDRDEEGYFNLELQISPLEFVEVIVSVATCFVTTKLLHQHQQPKGEEHKHVVEGREKEKITTDDGKDGSGGGVEKKNENPIIDIVEHDTDTMASKEHDTSKGDGHSTANSDQSSHQTSKTIQSAASNTKISKNKKNRTNKLEKENSQLGRKEKNREDKKISVPARPNVLDDLKSSELKSSPSAKRKVSQHIQETAQHQHGGEEHVQPTNPGLLHDIQEMKIEHDPKKMEEQLSLATIRPTESNMTSTGGMTSHVTSNDVTVIPKVISLDQFDTWSAKLNLFVESYLKPAFERSLDSTEKKDEEMERVDKDSKTLMLLVKFTDATPIVRSTVDLVR
eukprot:TCONS_00011537-protein